jgi:endonuclease-3
MSALKRAGTKPRARAAKARAATARTKGTPAAARRPRAKAKAQPKPPRPEELARAREILERLEKAYPDWGPTLDFSNPFELLVATILAAQATDESVNRVTVDLFKKYRGPRDYVAAPQAELEKDVHSLGFFRQKAKAVKAMSQGVLERFGGDVPREVERLTELHGVGRKTASIVAGAAYGVPSIAVDRHVERVAIRLGFVKPSDPLRTEAAIAARYPQEDWIKTTWCFVLHGRRTCQPTPLCPICVVRDLCPYPKKTKVLPPRIQALLRDAATTAPPRSA